MHSKMHVWVPAVLQSAAPVQFLSMKVRNKCSSLKINKVSINLQQNKHVATQVIWCISTHTVKKSTRLKKCNYIPENVYEKYIYIVIYAYIYAYMFILVYQTHTYICICIHTNVYVYLYSKCNINKSLHVSFSSVNLYTNHCRSSYTFQTHQSISMPTTI